jgi:hypothetical protein
MSLASAEVDALAELAQVVVFSSAASRVDPNAAQRGGVSGLMVISSRSPAAARL